MRRFAVTFDYRCPFARNAHEAVIAGVREGREWDVSFVPFSLDQVHVAEGEPPVWDRIDDPRWTGARALLWGLAVRDAFPDRFFDAHLAIFAARHDRGRKITDENVLRDAIARAGIDPGAVAVEIATGRPLKALAAGHDEALSRWGVFGVPTFIEGDEAVFVRFMERGNVADLERVLDMLAWRDLNEFKRTRVPR